MKRLYILPTLLLLMLSASACDSSDALSGGDSDYRVVYTVEKNGETVITCEGPTPPPCIPCGPIIP